MVLLQFSMSAVPLSKMGRVARLAERALKPGGKVFLRDYGRYRSWMVAGIERNGSDRRRRHGVCLTRLGEKYKGSGSRTLRRRR